MGADVSRVRFDPLDNFAGVELKQGGVLLDADFNEFASVVRRQMRAAASDILGPSRVSSITPAAFKIDFLAGALQIGMGRMYVAGLLADNHGNVSTLPAKKLFDPLMAEVSFADPIAYDAQPYLPNPPPLPTAGTHLVYLDVWQREVTHLQRPDLVEIAVGVETSSRLQTVWQVRVLENDTPGVTCASPDGDLTGWSELIAPSSGRLTTGTFEVPPSSDPCELPPTGGYRGLENQTYRVEIHDPGQPGGSATFKFSDNNACVGSRVANMVSPTELELQTLGRDDVLRFKTGDWVEITDDVREFSMHCGEMRRITAVNEATRRITFAVPLLTDMLPGAFPSSDFPRDRNMLVRLWRQNGKVLQTGAGGTTSMFQDLDSATSTGVINVPAADTTLLLEGGVTVRFASAAGATGCKAGDYWVFVVRTADASVQLLDNAPPFGIHHQYDKLAIWDVAKGDVTDCRHPWPPRGEGHDCSCTHCVTPGSHASGKLTIQMAIDQVKKAGGTVCLEVGDYPLEGPLKIDRAQSVKLVGKGTASRLLVNRAIGAIEISNSQDIVLDSFLVLSSAPSIAAPLEAVSVADSASIRVEHLTIRVESDDPQWAAVGLAGKLTDLCLRENALMAPTGIRSGTVGGGGAGQADLADMRIEDNDFQCRTVAIAFAAATVHQLVNRISGNRVIGCNETGFLLTGMTAPGFGLDVRANVLSVSGNGIIASLSGLRVLDNDILHAKGATGIILVPGPTASKLITNCQIVGNRIKASGGTGISVKASLRTVMIKQNQIAHVNVGLELGLELVSGDEFDQLSIENNQFNDIEDSAILAFGKGASYAATGNHIRTNSDRPAVVLDFKGGEGVFSHNECYRDGDGSAADVILKSSTLIVGNNRVAGGKTSLDIGPADVHYTVLGNICHGAIKVHGVDLGAPWAPLNLQDVL